MDEPKQDNSNPETNTTEVTEPIQTMPEESQPDIAPETPTTPEQPPAPVVSDKKRLSKRVKILLLVLVLTIAAGAGWLYYQNQQTETATSPATIEKAVEPKVAVKQTTFYDKPKLLKEPGFTLYDNYKTIFGAECDDNGKNCKATVSEKNFEYYAVGKTAEDEEIIVGGAYKYSSIDGPAAQIILMRESGPEVLLQHSTINPTNNAQFEQEVGDAFSDDITVNKSLYLEELTSPDTVTIQKQTFKYPYDTEKLTARWQLLIDGIDNKDILDKDAELEKIGTVDGKDYYRSVKKEQNFDIVEHYGLLKGVFIANYELASPLAKYSEKEKITWDDGTTTKESDFSPAPQGCGSINGYIRAQGIKIDGLNTIGESSNGTKLYELPIDSALFNTIYKEYGDMDIESIQDKKLRNLNKQQFSDKHMAFLTDDGTGAAAVNIHIYAVPRGGCGKPVVYLYPTETTNVNVTVGADVVVSEPLYPEGGWKNVLAQPNGQLTYQGKPYDSLYWEGYGDGPYPKITSGTVVTSDKAASTIRTQLKQQGLNAKETADFMEFWEPRLPKTAYTRLTWFSKAQVDRLAPLQVSPAPQTSIRVFLDFEGLDKPVSLPKQRLVQFERKGFTLVEWGGLLRDGIPPQND